MKRRNILLLISSMLIVVIAVYILWFLNSSPHLDSNEISSIQQFRMPSPPEIITVYDEETIQQFVEYFNTLDFTPLFLFRFPRGGWYARNIIEFKNSTIKYNIVYEEIYGDYMLVKFNHRYYNVSVISYGNLLDIISNKTIS